MTACEVREAGIHKVASAVDVGVVLCCRLGPDVGDLIFLDLHMWMIAELSRNRSRSQPSISATAKRWPEPVLSEAARLIAAAGSEKIVQRLPDSCRVLKALAGCPAQGAQLSAEHLLVWP